jgi:hypothetical protein
MALVTALIFFSLDRTIPLISYQKKLVVPDLVHEDHMLLLRPVHQHELAPPHLHPCRAHLVQLLVDRSCGDV